MTVKVTTPTTPARLGDTPLSANVTVGNLANLPACVSDKPAAGAGFESGYAYTQSVPASVWTVPHNLNRKPQVTVVDSFDEVLIADIAYIDPNIVRVTHSAPRIGAVYVS